MYVFGCPVRSTNDSRGAGNDTRYADPVSIWQSVQWQAETRSGSTSAVMLLSSPRASTFSSHASRSLLLGLRSRAASEDGDALV